MKFTLNQLKVELKAVQQAHGMLSPGDFFWGDPSRAWEESTLKYPLMCCYTAGTGGQMQERLTGVSLVVMIADKVYKDYKSLDDTESDTLNVSRQVFNVINKSGRWRKLLTVRSATATKFIDKGDDEITGWILQMQVDLKDSQSICDLPMFDYDFEDSSEGVTCPGVTVINSNMTYTQLVASGGILELPDTTVSLEDTLGGDLGTTDVPSVTGGVVVAPNASYAVEYQNGTPIQSGEILAGGSEIIQVPNPIVCADAIVNVNSVFWDNVPSGGTENIIVRQSTGSTQVGSIQGQYFRIADSTAVLKTTSNVTLSTTSIKAEDSEDIVAPDTSIEVNGVAEGSVVAGSTVDIQLSDSLGVVTPLSVTQTGNDFAVVLPTTVCPPAVTRSTATLMKTGQTTSYRTGDDGDLEAGRDTDFLTLDAAPLHNDGSATLNTTTARFTDTLGGSTYADNIVLDWSTWNGSTLLGWDRRRNGGGANVDVQWEAAIDAALAHTNGSFVTGWRLPNRGELNSIYNCGFSGSALGYAPFSNPQTNGYFLSSTTRPSSTNQIYALTVNSGALENVSKTAAFAPRWVAVRTFSLSTSNVLS
jgi:hypothetical protein